MAQEETSRDARSKLNQVEILDYEIFDGDMSPLSEMLISSDSIRRLL